MIPVADADEYLKLLLVEDKDVDTAFPQSARYRALQEAVIAYARLRPDQYAVLRQITYNNTLNAFELDDEFDRFLEFYGLEVGGEFSALQVKTPAQMYRENSHCWRTRNDKATSFVWSPSTPRIAFIDGTADENNGQRLICSVSLIDQTVDGNAGTDLKAPMSALPDIIDYALRRMYTREDTSAGIEQQYAQSFRSGVSGHQNIDTVYNPLTAYQVNGQ